MGTSTDGQICYGIKFKEGFEFPWKNKDIERWWRDVNGYVPLYKPFTDDGRDYAPGWSDKDKRLDEYIDHKIAWDKKNPIPFEMVNYCSGEYPMYILAVRGTILTANRGHPLSFDPNELKIPPDETKALVDFIEKYKIKNKSQMRWWLSSEWTC